MTIPHREDFLSAACRWHGEHRGIGYEISWHGRDDNYNPFGTWCYYILVDDEEFYPEDWAQLRLDVQDREFAGSHRRHWDYDKWPDLDAHGGWTFGEMETYLGRDGKEHERVKVGCNYNHLWDREAGFPDTKSTVELDVKHSIDLLAEKFPRRRLRCGYSGQYDDAENFYTAKNGTTVHKSQEEKLRADGWAQWLPARRRTA